MSKIDKNKYKNAILYFVDKCNNKYLGKTKLNKLLYYLDFIYYRDNGKSVTGDDYICQNYGPVPSRILDIMSELKREGKIDAEVIEGINMEKYTLKTKVDESCFNEKEKTLLKNICKEFCNYKTDRIVTQTHFEAPWFYASLYDKIDYEYANDIEFFVA